MKIKDRFKLYELSEKVGLFDADPDYIIRDAGDQLNSYIVTSWTHGKAPTNIYSVNKQGAKWKCNCPTRTPYCKHIDMVKQWIKDGKPSIIDRSADDELRRRLSQKGVKI